MNMYLRLLMVVLRARRAPKIGLWDTIRTNFRVNWATWMPSVT